MATVMPGSVGVPEGPGAIDRAERDRANQAAPPIADERLAPGRQVEIGQRAVAPVRDQRRRPRSRDARSAWFPSTVEDVGDEVELSPGRPA